MKDFSWKTKALMVMLMVVVAVSGVLLYLRTSGYRLITAENEGGMEIYLLKTYTYVVEVEPLPTDTPGTNGVTSGDTTVETGDSEAKVDVTNRTWVHTITGENRYYPARFGGIENGIVTVYLRGNIRSHKIGDTVKLFIDVHSVTGSQPIALTLQQDKTWPGQGIESMRYTAPWPELERTGSVTIDSMAIYWRENQTWNLVMAENLPVQLSARH